MSIVDDELKFKKYLLTECEYVYVRRLASGEWAGVSKMLFTFGLSVGLTDTGYRTRFCYEKLFDASDALEEWDGNGDPPGNWIKEKSIL